MPIRKNLRHLYGTNWRAVIRPRILARAANRCERCGKPNHTRVATTSGKGIFGPWMVWAITDAENLVVSDWTDDRREWASVETYDRENPEFRHIRVVLTVAHLNHEPADNRDENLKALCQWCHLIHDLTHHHESRAHRKDAARPLLA
jgi:hypothetical protein